MSIKIKKPIYSNIPKTLSIFNILVTIEYDGYFVISDNEINMYGVGDTVAEAEEDYKSIVLSYFEDLEENESKLDGHLKGHLDYLREKLSDYIRNDSNKTIKINA
jgi:predicted RNase H-like HicB family nuclease